MSTVGYFLHWIEAGERPGWSLFTQEQEREIVKRNLSDIQRGSNGSGMSMWSYVLFTLALCCIRHTWPFHLYVYSVLDLFWTSQSCLSQYFREFYRCWENPAWIYLHRWSRVILTKARRRGRNRMGHRAVGGAAWCAAMTHNGILLRRANVRPYNSPHLLTFLDRLSTITTAADQYTSHGPLGHCVIPLCPCSELLWTPSTAHSPVPSTMLSISPPNQRVFLCMAVEGWCRAPDSWPSSGGWWWAPDPHQALEEAWDQVHAAAVFFSFLHFIYYLCFFFTCFASG